MDEDPVGEATLLVADTWHRYTLTLGTMPAVRQWYDDLAGRALTEWQGERPFPLSGAEAVSLSYTLPEPLALELLRRALGA